MTSWAHPIPYVTGTSGAYLDLQRGVREEAFRTPFSFLTAPRLQSQVREDLLDDGLFQDGRDDHQLAAECRQCSIGKMFTDSPHNPRPLGIRQPRSGRHGISAHGVNAQDERQLRRRLK